SSFPKSIDAVTLFRRQPMPRSSILRVTLLAIFILSLSAVTFAQTVVDGSVHDSSSSGAAVAGASVKLTRENGSVAESASTAADGSFRFAIVEAGPYTLQVEAAGFYPAEHGFVLRPRQPQSLVIDLQKKETVQEKVEVRSTYQTIDPEKTGSSYTFTHQDLEN